MNVHHEHAAMIRKSSPESTPVRSAMQHQLPSLMERRRLLLHTAALSVSTLMACKNKDTCEPAQLSEDDQRLRETLKYSDRSPYPEKMCQGCQQFLPPKEGSVCGGCKVVKGPIHPHGYCTAFLAKG
jgi:hypothetical protein